MKRVIVVEDDGPLRDLVAEMLRWRGYKVFVAADGTEAVEVCAQCGAPVDVLVCDVLLPGVVSSEVVRVAVGLYPGMKVLLMTGWPDEQLIDCGPFRGRVCLLRKPFTLDRLLHCVRCVREGNACERAVKESGVHLPSSRTLGSPE